MSDDAFELVISEIDDQQGAGIVRRRTKHYLPNGEINPKYHLKKWGRSSFPAEKVFWPLTSLTADWPSTGKKQNLTEEENCTRRAIPSERLCCNFLTWKFPWERVKTAIKFKVKRRMIRIDRIYRTIYQKQFELSSTFNSTKCFWKYGSFT